MRRRTKLGGSVRVRRPRLNLGSPPKIKKSAKQAHSVAEASEVVEAARGCLVVIFVPIVLLFFALGFFLL